VGAQGRGDFESGELMKIRSKTMMEYLQPRDAKLDIMGKLDIKAIVTPDGKWIPARRKHYGHIHIHPSNRRK
jgi:hypothetical protein